MSERREFVEVERMGERARYSVMVPIEVDPIHARIGALERRIDRLDGMLDGMGKGAAARIEAIEHRIEKLEQRMDGKDETDGEMLLFFGKCFCDMERKLNHKGERTMGERTGGDE